MPTAATTTAVAGPPGARGEREESSSSSTPPPDLSADADADGGPLYAEAFDSLSFAASAVSAEQEEHPKNDDDRPPPSPSPPPPSKRPASAFLRFFHSKRRSIRLADPSVTNAEASKRAGEMWRNLDEDDRLELETIAWKEMDDWKKEVGGGDDDRRGRKKGGKKKRSEKKGAGGEERRKRRGRPPKNKDDDDSKKKKRKRAAKAEEDGKRHKKKKKKEDDDEGGRRKERFRRRGVGGVGGAVEDLDRPEGAAEAAAGEEETPADGRRRGAAAGPKTKKDDDDGGRKKKRRLLRRGGGVGSAVEGLERPEDADDEKRPRPGDGRGGGAGDGGPAASSPSLRSLSVSSSVNAVKLEPFIPLFPDDPSPSLASLYEVRRDLVRERAPIVAAVAEATAALEAALKRRSDALKDLADMTIDTLRLEVLESKERPKVDVLGEVGDDGGRSKKKRPTTTRAEEERTKDAVDDQASLGVGGGGGTGERGSSDGGEEEDGEGGASDRSGRRDADGEEGKEGVDEEDGVVGRGEAKEEEAAATESDEEEEDVDPVDRRIKGGEGSRSRTPPHRGSAEGPEGSVVGLKGNVDEPEEEEGNEDEDETASEGEEEEVEDDEEDEEDEEEEARDDPGDAIRAPKLPAFVLPPTDGGDGDVVTDEGGRGRKEDATASESSPPRGRKTWEDRYEELKNYKEEHGDCDVPMSFAGALGHWVANQRKAYRRLKQGTERPTTLTPERVELLNDLKFAWTGRRGRRQTRREGASEEAAKTGTSSSSDKKKKRDPPKEDIGKYVPSSKQRRWVEQFEALKRYKEEHGNFQIPTKTKLGQWAKYQRRSYSFTFDDPTNRRAMTPERAKVLEDIGFWSEWSPFVPGTKRIVRRAPNHDRWLARVEEAKRYKEVHGDYRPPMNTKLGQWAKEQRKFYRRTKREPNWDKAMSPERIQILDEMGFMTPPTARKPRNSSSLGGEEGDDDDGRRPTFERDRSWCDRQWLKRFAELKEYKERYGHLYVPTRNKDGRHPLNRWITDQRTVYRFMQKGCLEEKKRTNAMTPQRAKMLEDLGFEWVSPRTARVSEDYEEP